MDKVFNIARTKIQNIFNFCQNHATTLCNEDHYKDSVIYTVLCLVFQYTLLMILHCLFQNFQPNQDHQEEESTPMTSGTELMNSLSILWKTDKQNRKERKEAFDSMWNLNNSCVHREQHISCYQLSRKKETHTLKTNVLWYFMIWDFEFIWPRVWGLCFVYWMGLGAMNFKPNLNRQNMNRALHVLIWFFFF